MALPVRAPEKRTRPRTLVTRPLRRYWIASMKTLLEEFPEIVEVHICEYPYGIDIHVNADFLDRSREDAYYKREGDFVITSPDGPVLHHLFNKSRYLPPNDFIAPGDGLVLRRKSS